MIVLDFTVLMVVTVILIFPSHQGDLTKKKWCCNDEGRSRVIWLYHDDTLGPKFSCKEDGAPGAILWDLCVRQTNIIHEIASERLVNW